MKKIIYLLLVVFGMNAPKQMYAQEILSVQPHYDAPCEGTVVNIYVDRSYQNVVDSIIWTKGGSKLSLPAGWTYDSQIGHVDCYGFTLADNGNYEVTCYMSNGSVQTENIQLAVNPNPNASYTLTPKCFGVVLQPIGADMYYKYDDHGGFSIPFTSDTITTSIVGGGFRAMNNNDCYIDVVVSPFSAPSLFGITLIPTKYQIKPGQTSTLTVSANWPTVMSKTKWYKVTGVGQTSISTLIAQGCSTLTVSDTGLYKVQMRATVASGNCLKSKQVRIKAQVVSPGARIEEGDDVEQLESQESILDLQIGPNPAHDQIQVTGYDQDVVIFDINGRLIQSYTFDTFGGNERPQVVDVSYLPNGMYFVCSGEQKTKLVIQR